MGNCDNNSTTNGSLLAEYNKKLRESTVKQTFQCDRLDKLDRQYDALVNYNYDRLVNYSYNSEMDEEEEYGFKKAYFYNNENFYEIRDNR